MLIYPEPDPVLLSIGSLKIHWYGFSYLAAMVVGWLLARWRVRRNSMLNWKTSDLDDLLHPDPGDRDAVAWKEWGGEDDFSLSRSPLEVGPHLATALAEGPERIVFTSATLAAGKDFSYFAQEAPGFFIGLGVL